jgi:hypothetical protein
MTRAAAGRARFLYVVRNPRGLAASHLAASASSWGSWAAKTAFEAAVWWRKGLTRIEEARPALCGDLIEVRYEDLFVKGDALLEELAAFVGLPPFPERPKDLSELVPLHCMRSSGPAAARHYPQERDPRGLLQERRPQLLEGGTLPRRPRRRRRHVPPLHGAVRLRTLRRVDSISISAPRHEQHSKKAITTACDPYETSDQQIKN